MCIHISILAVLACPAPCALCNQHARIKSERLLQVDRATFVESQAKKTDNAYVDQMETDLKASLNEISSRLADKCDTKLLEYLQDSTELQAQRCESSLKALTGNVARVEARVRPSCLCIYCIRQGITACHSLDANLQGVHQQKGAETFETSGV